MSVTLELPLYKYVILYLSVECVYEDMIFEGSAGNQFTEWATLNKYIILLSSMYVCSCGCSLCRSQWPHVSAYRRRHEDGFSFKKLYLQLDEATLTFNADPVLVSLVILRCHPELSTLSIILRLHVCRFGYWCNLVSAGFVKAGSMTVPLNLHWARKRASGMSNQRIVCAQSPATNL